MINNDKCSSATAFPLDYFLNDAIVKNDDMNFELTFFFKSIIIILFLVLQIVRSFLIRSAYKKLVINLNDIKIVNRKVYKNKTFYFIKKIIIIRLITKWKP